MSRIAILVDGLNLYHALDYSPNNKDHYCYRKYKWLSYRKLANAYITPSDTIEGIYYFTTLATWNQNKVVRHKLFIKAQEAEGITVIYGEFKRKQKQCLICNNQIWTFEEKQTDVNIALTLFQLAVKDAFDKAIIISGDTDLLPAVKAVQKTFPGKTIGVVIPIGRASEDFKCNVDFHFRMKEHQLKASLLPNPFVLSDGTKLQCPPNWK